MKVQKLLIPALILALALVLILPACSSQTTPATSAPATSAPATSAPPPTTSAPAKTSAAPTQAAAPLKITYWGYGKIVDEEIAAKTIFPKVEKALGQKIDLNWQSGPVYGTGFDVINILKSGTVDMANSFTAYTISELPLMSICGILFTSKYPESAFAAMKDLRKEFPEIEKEYEKYNIKYLGISMNGPMTLLTKKPITRLEDLKGMNIRAVGSSAVAYQKLGVTPVNISWGEIYTSLQKGVIDGVSGVLLAGTYVAKFQEVTKYAYNLDFGTFGGNWMGINMDFWKKLPKATQDALYKEFDDNWTLDTSKYYNDVINPQLVTDYKRLGNTIGTVPDEMKKQVKQLAESAGYEEWLQRVDKAGYKNGQQILDRYKQLCDKYDQTITRLYFDPVLK